MMMNRLNLPTLQRRKAERHDAVREFGWLKEVLRDMAEDTKASEALPTECPSCHRVLPESNP